MLVKGLELLCANGGKLNRNSIAMLFNMNFCFMCVEKFTWTVSSDLKATSFYQSSGNTIYGH